MTRFAKPTASRELWTIMTTYGAETWEPYGDETRLFDAEGNEIAIVSRDEIASVDADDFYQAARMAEELKDFGV